MANCKVFVVGAGIMEGAITTRLLETGHDVYVYDLDILKMQALVDKGAVAVHSLYAGVYG